jgi:sortase A
MLQAGLWSFRTHQLHSSDSHAASAQPDNSKVNFALWSEKRVRAYKDALAMHLEAPIAVLSIPSVGIEVPVFEGTDGVTMNRGAGRIEGTAGPGEPGNIGIAAHRDGFFRRLKDIHVGDHVELSTSGENYVYAVGEILIVDPADVSVLRPQPQPSLTLVTCYPFYFVGDAPQRYIVHASLVEKKSAITSMKSAVQHNEREDMP